MSANPPNPPLVINPSTINYFVSELGFKHDRVVEELKRANGDLNVAMNALLAQQQFDFLKNENQPMVQEQEEEFNNVNIAAFQKLMANKKTCDAELTIGKKATKVQVHKAILSAASKVFETFFYPQPGSQEPQTLPFLEEIEIEDFNIFLEFCYTNRIIEITEPSLLTLSNFAYKIDMGELKVYLAERLQTLINENNALKLFQETTGPIYENLRLIISTYICLNASKLLSKKDALNALSLVNAVAILNLKLERINERVLLSRVIEYVNANTDSWISPKEKYTPMKPLISLIRLDKLGADGIMDAAGTGFFKKKDLLGLILRSNEYMRSCKGQYH